VGRISARAAFAADSVIPGGRGGRRERRGGVRVRLEPRRERAPPLVLAPNELGVPRDELVVRRLAKHPAPGSAILHGVRLGARALRAAAAGRRRRQLRKHLAPQALEPELAGRRRRRRPAPEGVGAHLARAREVQQRVVAHALAARVAAAAQRRARHPAALHEVRHAGERGEHLFRVRPGGREVHDPREAEHGALAPREERVHALRER
jgi:hypothetical protein